MLPQAEQAEMGYLVYAIRYNLSAEEVIRLHSKYKDGNFLGFPPYVAAETQYKKGKRVAAALSKYLAPYVKELEKEYTNEELQELFMFLMYYSVVWDSTVLGGADFSSWRAEQAVENTVGKVYKIK